MKIAFVGKGGSGKTTLTALVSRFLASKNYPVVAIDADINQHLGRCLGLTEEEVHTLPPMGTEIDRIKSYLRGTNSRISKNTEMIKTTPPGTGSNLLTIKKDNPIYDYFSKHKDGVRLMAVGSISEEDVGSKCYHSKTGAVELLLNHTIDKEEEYLIVDMTAGADSFSSGLFTRFDITFLVVEPTIKSLSVYEQYKEFAKGYDVTIKVIGNKIEDLKDVDFLKKHTHEDLVAVITQSQFIKRIDRGEILPITDLEESNVTALSNIIACINAQKKDWKKFYEQALLFHEKNAKSWGNSATGKNLMEQVDPTFTMKI